MIVICNGVYKTGSTWIFTFLRIYFAQNEILGKLASKNNKFNPKLSFKFLSTYSHQPGKPLICKIHSYHPLDLSMLIEDLNIYCIATVRDPKSIMESYYFHYVKEKSTKIPKWLFFITVGFLKLVEVLIYQETVKNPKFQHYVVEYDELRTDPIRAFRKLLYFLGEAPCDGFLKECIERSDFRNTDRVESRSGMTDRSWFFSRPQEKLNRLESIALKIAYVFASVLKKAVFLFSSVEYAVLSLRGKQIT